MSLLPGDGVILTGLGYDSHRLEAGRPLILGGVTVPFERGLAGHSDADVLTHAIIDALLGAAGLGDIGEHFPDNDERYLDADSLMLLGVALTTVVASGFEPVNVDATVIMQRPRLSAHREEIRTKLARVLGLASRRVNVKATTGEGIGFVGREEGVAAVAVVSLRER